jgi:ribonuclease J
VIKSAPRTTYLTTFSSNLWSINVVIDVCRKLNKKLHLIGSGMLKTLKIADDLGLMPFASDVLCDEAELSFIPAQNLVVLATGCQGEPRAALPRIINGDHPTMQIEPLDTVVFSSRVIPGNELGVLDLVNKCTRMGVQVITARQEPLVHVSGHACQDDLKELIERLRPKNFMPVHGTYSHLVANELLAALDTHAKPEIIRVDNGVKVSLRNGQVDLSEPFDVSRLYVESWSRLTTEPVVLRERLKVAEVGAAFFSGVYLKKDKAWQVKPQLETVGLDFPDRVKMDSWLQRVFDRAGESLQRELTNKVLSPEDLKENLRLLIRRELTDIFVKKPVVYVQLHLL